MNRCETIENHEISIKFTSTEDLTNFIRYMDRHKSELPNYELSDMQDYKICTRYL